MSISKEDILSAISEMSVMDLVQLVKDMEEKFGVSAAAMMAPMAMPAAGQAAAAEEKTEFNVHITSFGENKIGVIKVVRELTGLGLKEAKDLVEKIPTVFKEGVTKQEADELKKKFEEAGAAVEIK